MGGCWHGCPRRARGCCFGSRGAGSHVILWRQACSLHEAACKPLCRVTSEGSLPAGRKVACQTPPPRRGPGPPLWPLWPLPLALRCSAPAPVRRNSNGSSSARHGTWRAAMVVQPLGARTPPPVWASSDPCPRPCICVCPRPPPGPLALVRAVHPAAAGPVRGEHGGPGAGRHSRGGDGHGGAAAAGGRAGGAGGPQRRGRAVVMTFLGHKALACHMHVRRGMRRVRVRALVAGGGGMPGGRRCRVMQLI